MAAVDTTLARRKQARGGALLLLVLLLVGLAVLVTATAQATSPPGWGLGAPMPSVGGAPIGRDRASLRSPAEQWEGGTVEEPGEHQHRRLAIPAVWDKAEHWTGERTAGAMGQVRTVCVAGLPACDFDSVQAAVDAAEEGDRIKVAEGRYADLHARPSPPGFLGPAVVTQVLYLTKTVSITGGYTLTNGFADPPNPDAHPTTLDAGGGGRVVFVSGAITPTIEGLRITGGNAAGLGGDPFSKASGGGIYVAGAAATISHCLVYSNTAGSTGGGGGVYLDKSQARLIGNQIRDNSAGLHGGGAYLWFSPATLQENRIEANTAITWGGGLSLVGSNARLESNQIVSNTGGYGGGLVTDSCDPTLVGNDVSHNEAIAGGGLYLSYAGWIGVTRVLSNTFQDNTAWLAGGVLLIYAPNEFRGNVVSGNSAGDGGGLWMFSSDTDFSGNRFTDNTATATGGGLRLDTSTDTRLIGNDISRNQAGDGGGLYLLSTPAMVYGNRFEANQAGWGAGLTLSESNASLVSNTITYNAAAIDGGGLMVRDSQPVLTNNIVAGNTAGGSGSALFLTASRARLVHNTLAENTGGDGTGIQVSGGESAVGTVALTNTILVSHTTGITVAAGCTATLEATLWGNGVDWGGEGAIVTGTHNLWGPAAFRDPATGDYHLRRESAAVDAGLEAGVKWDIDGDVRPLGAGVDLGADEFGADVQLFKAAWPDPVTAGSALTYTLAVTNSGYVTLNAIIVDHLPVGVAPGGSMTWTAEIGPGKVWTQGVVGVVEAGYAGVVTNVLTVDTLEGVVGSAISSVTVIPPPYSIYVPLVQKAN